MNRAIIYICVLNFILLPACKKPSTVWQGQDAIKKVSTATVPIVKQVKGIFDLGDGVYISNDFAGARLNGVVRTEDGMITAIITPENTPINESPWYAFKIWADSAQQVSFLLTYHDGVRHRYYPKLSRDGLQWENLDSTRYTEGTVDETENDRNRPDDITMLLDIGPDTLWVSAQELITLTHVQSWIEELESKPFVSSYTIGTSREGRPIDLLKIGEGSDDKIIFVIARQHPPEATGYLAMEAFVEALCADQETAAVFRKEYTTYVVPLANPDGVANGHWRHNTGGIDLNRDWLDFHQPETRTMHYFLQERAAAGSTLYFGVDFHSTWEDIYYTIDPELKGNFPGLVPKMIEATGKAIPGYQPNIRPRLADEARVTSLDYFFHTYGAESLVYEIGDNTGRELLKRKGDVSANAMMELLLAD